MDKTGEKIKYINEFKDEADAYIHECLNSNLIPNLKGFAERIGTDKDSVLAWANKKIKDENGNLTEQLARPQFHSKITYLQELEKKAEINKKTKNKKVKPKQEPKNKENNTDEVKKEDSKDDKKSEDKENIKINQKQELFCQYYATDKEFFGNGVEAYAEAYDLDISVPKHYNTAKTNAWRLLTNADILKRIDQLLELGPLNNTFVDRQLAKIIAQDADFSSKVAAIREYNKLKQRITDKIEEKATLTITMTNYDDSK